MPTSFGGDVIRFNELRAQATPKLVGFSIALDRGFTLLVILMHVFNIYIYYSNHFTSKLYFLLFISVEILVAFILIEFFGNLMFKIKIKFQVYLISIVLSYISLLLLLMAFAFLLSYENFDKLIVFYHFPISLVLSALPVSIGGWGLREAYLVSLSPLVKFANMMALSSVLFGIINIFSGLPGMVIYLLKIKK